MTSEIAAKVNADLSSAIIELLSTKNDSRTSTVLNNKDEIENGGKFPLTTSLRHLEMAARKLRKISTYQNNIAQLA
jgi:hypothetical protein